MNKKILAIISFCILTSVMMNVSIITTAHTPQNMQLFYDINTQELSVTIVHIVANPDFHYVMRVEISKNGELYSVNNYTFQPTNSQFVYNYDVAAQDGDILEVTAICSLFGSLTESLTVSGNQPLLGEIEIGTVKSGFFNIRAEIKNIAPENAENVSWEISVKGGLLALVDRTWTGMIPIIPAESSKTVRSGIIFGIGKLLIKVRAGPREDLTVEKNFKGTGRIIGVTVEPDLKISLEPVAEGFVAPVDMADPRDGTNRLFIVDQVGVIHLIKNGVLQSVPFLNITDKMVVLNEFFDERGLLGMAFHPDFINNGKFYVFYSAPAENLSFNCTSIIAQYNVSTENEDVADPNSEQIILTVDKPEFNHNGGQLVFGPEGYLYIALGDGGGANDQHGDIGNGQNISTLLGSILRIDVDSGFPYVIPSDNPFVGIDGLDEIYTFGFRNPWRFSYDQESNRFFVADVGQNKYEELNIMEKGKNYGWRIMEGFHEFDSGLADILGINISDLEKPIVEYSHGMGLSIVGGYVYHGNQSQALQGKYIFGDWSDGFLPAKGRLFYLEETEKFGFIRYEFIVDGNESIPYVRGFGQDIGGEVYVLTSESIGPTGTTGKVSHIVLI